MLPLKRYRVADVTAQNLFTSFKRASFERTESEGKILFMICNI